MISHRVCSTSLILLIPLVFLVGPDRLVWAWTEYPRIIHETLACLPEVRDDRPVRSESLDAFLMAEEKGLVSLLAGEEA